MKNLALPRVQKMKPYSPPLTDRREYNGLLLDFNERTVPPGKKVSLAAAKAAESQNLQIYPEYSELEKLIGRYVGVSRHQIMLTNGSDQAIEVIFRTFTDKDDQVIVPAPSFDMFFQVAGVVGNRLIIPLYNKADLAFPLDKVMESIDDTTKLIVICNPNNPTGTLLQAANIEKIAKKAENSIVYVDEAYFEFSGVSAAGLISKYPNIIITRTFSKAFGLASLRVGYIIADERYILEMMKVRGPYPVNMAGYGAALAALKDKEYMQSYVSEVTQEARPAVERFFTDNKINFYPSSANFILFKPDNPDEIYERLARAGILLRPQSKPNIEGTLRLSIGTLSQMKRFCDIYKKAVLS